MRLKRLEKKLVNLSELIVDTSFLLPFVGIKVRGVDVSQLEGKVLYYPSLMLTELLAVIIKEARKLKLVNIPEEAIKGLSYILSEVRLIPLNQLDINLIYEVVNRGWSDIFDSILYSASVSTGLPLITLDYSFYEFLHRNGFETNNLIIIKEK